ncbi:MAG: 3-methyl-2-oxobutanoate hydroxymethyltransferase [Candidatus Omnitrophica bacterium]|nr:3-methyl-2-oxobutanoate hydroxymethyltransferase [Candidatus Omnitrophota bacterium]MDD5661370.1 3-methyl-2-oxobutanoate hydroxymethyltransferase [Candidatus Omnitrophota bacterium]
MNISEIIALKNKRKITMLTAYDYPIAELLDKAGIDIILVGDSLANVVLGLDSTTEVGMPEMLHHTRAVRRAVKNALLVADMPFDSYQLNPDDCLKNAQEFIDQAGAQAIKLEWFERALEVTSRISSTGIPVMGHIGLTPQTVDKIGGFKCQGKDAESANRLIEQAVNLEEKGCFAIVLECVPDKIARIITKKIKIPTIGIGAGVHCDGQVLVVNDMLGLFQRYTPKFVKKYADIGSLILKAATEFKEEVIGEKFPDAGHSFTIKEEELKKIEEA